MTDKEIVKIAEHCAHWKCFEDCEKCYAFKIYQYNCGFHMTALYLDLIDRQKAEIERLKAELKELDKPNCSLEEVQQEEWEQSKYFNLAVECARDKAIKEFAKLIIDKSQDGVIHAADILDLAREMTEVHR